MAAAINKERRAIEKINAHAWMCRGRTYTTSSNAMKLLSDYEHQPRYVRELIELQWRGQQKGGGGI